MVKKERRIQYDVETFTQGDDNNGVGMDRNIKLEVLIMLTKLYLNVKLI